MVEERQRRHHRTKTRHKVLHPCRSASSFFLDLMTGRCRFAQPPATCFDASGIILIRDVSFLTATSIIRGLSRSLSSLVKWICRNAYWNRIEARGPWCSDLKSTGNLEVSEDPDHFFIFREIGSGLDQFLELIGMKTEHAHAFVR